MFGSDVFLLARIANGEPERSLARYDLSRISTALQPLAERLIAAGHLERRAIWDEFLARGFERAPTPGATPEPKPTADAVAEPIEPSPPAPLPLEDRDKGPRVTS